MRVSRISARGRLSTVMKRVLDEISFETVSNAH
jgi:hypothetical protein